MTETPWWEDDDPERPTAEYAPAPVPEKKPRAKAKPIERLSTTPRTWSECLQRLAYVFGGHSDECTATAQEWIEQAVEACWGARSLHDVSRPRRQIALQRTVGTVLALEDLGEVSFAPDLRDITRRAFARYWNGVVLEGPPWRLSPTETLPTYAEWAAAASFEISPGAGTVTVP